MTNSCTSKQIEFASKMKNIEVSDLVYEYIENRLLKNDLSVEVAVKIAQMACILGLNHEDAFEEHYKELFDVVIGD
ncbi:hypothetical protein ABVY41_004767 [Vibrio parahaemolyticus]|nr:hypothetical protein [Vibrio alginolyticus]EJC6922968.1 hypothetical protein [Vibrio parahaemolyticus]